MNPIFTGSGVAIVTPFTQDGKVNYTVLQRLIEFQLENGTDAIVVCGTTGEASTLKDEEQLEVIRFAAEIVNKRVPVIAGAGSNDTVHGVSLCRGSQKAGADACLLVTPYYNKTTQKGLIRHFTTMAASTDLPIILYSVQSRTALNIEPATACALSKIENIVAIKEASSNIVQIAEIAQLCGDNLTIYSGNDDQIVPVMSLGGKGVISVVANIAPRQTHELTEKFLSGDIVGSLKLQLEMLPLVKSLFCEVNPIPVKAALNLMGYDVGGYRAPLYEMEEGHLSYLKEKMTAYGLL